LLEDRRRKVAKKAEEEARAKSREVEAQREAEEALRMQVDPGE